MIAPSEVSVECINSSGVATTGLLGQWQQDRHYAGGTTVSMAFKRKVPQVLMKIQNLGHSFAEGKRFELLVRGYRTLVFKTSSFGRSDNLPVTVVFHRQLAATKTALLKHSRKPFGNNGKSAPGPTVRVQESAR